MVVTLSRIIVLLTGVSLCMFAAWGLWAPQKILQTVKGIMDRDWGVYLAVIVRLVLGIALVLYAPDSRFPTTFLILGWIAIAAAVAAALLGRVRLQRFVDWWIEKFTPVGIRLWLLIAMVFGAFLIYGSL